MHFCRETLSRVWLDPGSRVDMWRGRGLWPQCPRVIADYADRADCSEWRDSSSSWAGIYWELPLGLASPRHTHLNSNKKSKFPRSLRRVGAIRSIRVFPRNHSDIVA